MSAAENLVALSPACHRGDHGACRDHLHPTSSHECACSCHGVADAPAPAASADLVERLERWADAREDRNGPGGHGRTGTDLLREAAREVERLRDGAPCCECGRCHGPDVRLPAGALRVAGAAGAGRGPGGSDLLACAPGHVPEGCVVLETLRGWTICGADSSEREP